VPVDEEGRLAAVFSFDAGDETGALGVRLCDVWLEPDFAELLGDVLGGLPLPRAGVITGIGGVDSDEVPANPDDFFFGPAGYWRVSHPPIVPLPCCGVAR